MRYPIAIHKDPDSDFGVTVPDLPGCFSAGSSLGNAIVSAREAIACHVEGMLSDGEKLPAAQSIETHRRNFDFADVVWAVVEFGDE